MITKRQYNNIFHDNEDSITNCSCDSSHNTALVTSEHLIINFDKVVEQYSIKNNLIYNKPQSIDSLFVNESDIIFVEFKNKSKIDKVDIKNKIYSSIYVLMDICDLTTDFIRENIQFILVYKKKDMYDNIEAYHQIVKTTKKLAKEEPVRFNMQEHKNIFKNVFTYSSDEFQVNFIDRYYSNL